MSKTLELPDDLAALLDTPQKQAEALARLRERSQPRPTKDEMLARLAALRATAERIVPADTPVLSEEAYDRESIYRSGRE